MSYSRRQFIRDGGIGLLTFQLAGCATQLTPEQAHGAGVSLKKLSGTEAKTLAALGEVLLPGSAEKGLVEFIDHQLAAPVEEQLLMIKYVGPPPPYDGFYQGGLAALNQAAQAAAGADFANLSTERQTKLVGEMAQGKLENWGGPPPPFFYFVLRNDAVDVSYGTKSGMESLGVPYMAHIEPSTPWEAG
ncbi:MAG: gluconate 2-dehydrogenase subunit 3 family protein [Pseudomonadota bacterium]